MVITGFKILLIILIALPVIAASSYFYSQMLSFIRARNAIENEAVREGVSDEKSGKSGKKSKKNKKKEQDKQKEGQQ